MSENGNLRIHTQMTPEDGAAAANKDARIKKKPWRGAARRTRPRLDFGDRLLRNSAVACAVLLGILALGNIRQPWAEKATGGIKRALSMRVDLDESIGELTFVKQLMPESALVFLNVSGDGDMSRPCDAAVTHPWSRLQPWMLYAEGNRAIYAAAAGTVTAVSPFSDGAYGLLIDHGEGLETMYANLSQVDIKAGDQVQRGEYLGACEGGLYFELRQDGESVDPSERLGA